MPLAALGAPCQRTRCFAALILIEPFSVVDPVVGRRYCRTVVLFIAAQYSGFLACKTRRYPKLHRLRAIGRR